MFISTYNSELVYCILLYDKTDKSPKMVNSETRFINDYAMLFTGDHRITYTCQESVRGFKKSKFDYYLKRGFDQRPPPLLPSVKSSQSCGGDGHPQKRGRGAPSEQYCSMALMTYILLYQERIHIGYIVANIKKKSFFYSFRYWNLRHFDALISQVRKRKKIDNIPLV